MTESHVVKGSELIPSNQMALQLFQDFPASIKDADKDIGYNKPKTLIQVSSLSLLARRSINAFYFLVYDAQEEAEAQVANLSYFKWLIGFDSRNISHLKKGIEEAQKTLVQVSVYDEKSPEKEKWLSVALVGKVAIANGKIAFSVDSAVRNLIKNPDQFSYLSLRILSAFTSQYAMEIYEKLLSYQKDGVTPWMTLETFDTDWVKLKGDQREFKYINRDIISPALAQINDISNLSVKIEPKKAVGSRKVTEFRFRISDNPTGKMVIGADDRIRLKEMFQILTNEFGLSDPQIESIVNISPEKIWSAIEYTRSRVASGVRIGIPAKYFLSALEGGWNVPKGRLAAPETPAVKKEKEKKEKANRKAVMDESAKSVSKGAEIVEEFLEAAVNVDNKQHAVDAWIEFLSSPGAKLLGKNAVISEDYEVELKNKKIRMAFAGFLSAKRGKQARA